MLVVKPEREVGSGKKGCFHNRMAGKQYSKSDFVIQGIELMSLWRLVDNDPWVRRIISMTLSNQRMWWLTSLRVSDSTFFWLFLRGWIAPEVVRIHNLAFVPMCVKSARMLWCTGGAERKFGGGCFNSARKLRESRAKASSQASQELRNISVLLCCNSCVDRLHHRSAQWVMLASVVCPRVNLLWHHAQRWSIFGNYSRVDVSTTLRDCSGCKRLWIATRRSGRASYILIKSTSHSLAEVNYSRRIFACPTVKCQNSFSTRAFFALNRQKREKDAPSRERLYPNNNQ